MLAEIENYIKETKEQVKVIESQLDKYLIDCEDCSNREFTIVDQELFFEKYLKDTVPKKDKLSYVLDISNFIKNAHGEIETLLEIISTKYLEKSWELLENEGILNAIIANLIYYKPLDNVINTKKELHTKISKNNGIKVHNIKILYPVLFQKNTFEETVLSTFNTFGSARGQLTHHDLKEKTIYIQKNSDFLKHISMVNICIKLIEDEIIKELDKMFDKEIWKL